MGRVRIAFAALSGLILGLIVAAWWRSAFAQIEVWAGAHRICAIHGLLGWTYGSDDCLYIIYDPDLPTETWLGDRPNLGAGRRPLAALDGEMAFGFLLDVSRKERPEDFAIILPLWLIALPFALTFVFCVRDVVRARRFGSGLCPRCGYDLRATPEWCPECGPEPDRLRHPVANRLLLAGRRLAAFGTVAAAALLGVTFAFRYLTLPRQSRTWMALVAAWLCGLLLYIAAAVRPGRSRCPRCGAARDADAAKCGDCGLLLRRSTADESR